MRTILSRTVSIAFVLIQLLSLAFGIRLDEPVEWPLLVLWLYLPGYLANTAAMLGGKWIPDLTGIKPARLMVEYLSDGYESRRWEDLERLMGLCWCGPLCVDPCDWSDQLVKMGFS